jgi:hypothetical protein
MLLPKIIKFSGILFLLSLLVPILNWTFILSQFISTEANSSINILNNETFFRLNIVISIFTTLIILALGLCLYIILRTISKNMALVAFSLKMIEAILTAILALVYYIAFLALKDEPQNIELQKGFNFLIKYYISFTAIPGIFLGLSMIIYSYLFFKSGHVPVKLAFFGIVSYSLVTFYDFLTILLPRYADMLFIQIAGGAPVCIFQLFIGLWLLSHGIRMNVTKSADQSLFSNKQ